MIYTCPYCIIYGIIWITYFFVCINVGLITTLLYWKHFLTFLWNITAWIYMAVYPGFYNLKLNVNNGPLAGASPINSLCFFLNSLLCFNNTLISFLSQYVVFFCLWILIICSCSHRFVLSYVSTETNILNFSFRCIYNLLEWNEYCSTWTPQGLYWKNVAPAFYLLIWNCNDHYTVNSNDHYSFNIVLSLSLSGSKTEVLLPFVFNCQVFLLLCRK